MPDGAGDRTEFHPGPIPGREPTPGPQAALPPPPAPVYPPSGPAAGPDDDTARQLAAQGGGDAARHTIVSAGAQARRDARQAPPPGHHPGFPGAAPQAYPQQGHPAGIRLPSAPGAQAAQSWPPPGTAVASPPPGVSTPAPGQRTPPPGWQGTPQSGWQGTPPPGWQGTPPPGWQGTPPPGIRAPGESGSGFGAGAWSGPPPATDNLPAGTVIDETYEILEKLGQGGMGAVYKARHRLLEKDVALKVIAAQMAQDPRFRARFLREAKVAMEFIHPHAVQIRHFAITREGICYMVMDFSAGESLQAIIKRDGALPPRRAARIIRQILTALGEAHRKRIIHRDLKPDNVLVEKDGADDFVKVLDFGLAKGLGAENEGLTIAEGGDKIVGTPAYMSPEQACGEDADHRSDLYSVGVILYQCLCGQVPFSAANPSQVMRKQVSAPPPPMRSFRADLVLPDGLEDVVAKALAKEKGDRFQSAEQLHFALEKVAEERATMGAFGTSGVGGANTALNTAGMGNVTQQITGNLTGQTIDRYKIVAPIGEGGMGAVYKAEHILTHRSSALKVIRSNLSQSEEAIQRFQREAQISSKFKHPAAVEVYDFGRLGENAYFLALEYVRGTQLTDRLKKGALPVRDVVEIAVQSCAALGAAHRAGIVHRDLKPDNIMLGEVGEWRNQVKILDFGIAKMRDAQGEAGRLKTTMGVFFGTPKYASPEQCAGQSVDARSDIYTFGCILYELLTGIAPFESETAQGYLGQHMAVAPRKMKIHNPKVDVPPAVEAVIVKAMAKEPDARFQSADELSTALQKAAGYWPRFEASEMGLRLAGEGGPGKRTSPLALVAVALVVALLSFVGFKVLFQKTEATLALTLTPPAAKVEVLKADGSALTQGTGEGGKYALASLAAGTYRLRVSADGFEPLEREVTLEEGRTLALPITLDRSRAEERKVFEARRQGVLEGRTKAEGAQAASQPASAQAFEKAAKKLEEADEAAKAGKLEVALGLLDVARTGFEEAKAEAEKAAGEQARADMAARRVEAARKAAEKAAAKAFAESVLARAEGEAKAAQDLLASGDRTQALAKLANAEALFQEAQDRARGETDRRISQAKKDFQQWKVEASKLDAASQAAARWSEASQGFAKAEVAEAGGDVEAAVKGFEAAAQAMGKARDEANAKAGIARRRQAFTDAVEEATAAEARTAEARQAAQAARAMRFAPKRFQDAKDLEADGQKALGEARAAAAADTLEALTQAAALVETARQKLRDARDEYGQAERMAQRKRERQEKEEALEQALSRARAAKQAFADALAQAKAKQGETGPAEAKAQEAEAALAQAEAAARTAQDPASEASEVSRAADLASKAAEAYQVAKGTAEAALAAAGRPSTGTSSGGSTGDASGPAVAVDLAVRAYKRAMEAKDLAAVERCFIDFSSMKAGYKAMFSRAKSIEVATGAPLLRNDDEAEVVVAITVTEGSRKGKPSKAKLIFARAGGGFKIASIEGAGE